MKLAVCLYSIAIGLFVACEIVSATHPAVAFALIAGALPFACLGLWCVLRHLGLRYYR